MRAVILATSLLLGGILAGCISTTDDSPAGEVPEPEDLLAVVGEGRLLPFSSFEPTIAIDSQGALYMSTFDGGTGFATRIARSLDQGITWEDITPRIGPVSYPPNSNDPYVYVDPATDRLFLFEMQGLSCNQLAFSDDQGETWTMSPIGCTPTQGIQDHQTLFAAKPRPGPGGVTPPTVGYDSILYYCVNRVIDSGCSMSLDSGMTWGPFRPLIYEGVDPQRLDPGTIDTGDPGSVEDFVFEPICGGLHAHGQSGPSGLIYLPRDVCGVPTVAISGDNGANWELVTISDDPTHRARNHEVTVAADEAGNVFATWLGRQGQVWFAASHDEGFTWSETIDVRPEGVNLTYFPVIAAGGPGRVAIAYIGTSANATEYGYGNLTTAEHWDAFLTVATGLETGLANGTWRTAQVNPEGDPVARGICGNTRCDGMGDFLEIKIDAEGRPWGAFVDVCHEECIEAETDPTCVEKSNNPAVECRVHDKAIGMVGTLTQGPALRGALVPLPALAAAEEASPAEAS